MSDSRTNPYRMLLLAFVLVFILISVAEVWLLTVVGSSIGVGWILAILLLEAVVGALLLRHEGSKSWRALVAAYEAGRVPTGQLADAALVLAGGIMLILPGFLTDILGLIFLLPFTRPYARKTLGWVVAHSALRDAPRGSAFPSAPRRRSSDPRVVPGEVVDQAPAPKPPASPGERELG